jgi:hypothetical protein
MGPYRSADVTDKHPIEKVVEVLEALPVTDWKSGGEGWRLVARVNNETVIISVFGALLIGGKWHRGYRKRLKALRQVIKHGKAKHQLSSAIEKVIQ